MVFFWYKLTMLAYSEWNMYNSSDQIAFNRAMNYESMKEAVISYVTLILIAWTVSSECIWGTFAIKPLLSFKNEIETKGEREDQDGRVGWTVWEIILFMRTPLTSSGIPITHLLESPVNAASLRLFNLSQETSSLD